MAKVYQVQNETKLFFIHDNSECILTLVLKKVVSQRQDIARLCR
jgi:hypothetical protein